MYVVTVSRIGRTDGIRRTLFTAELPCAVEPEARSVLALIRNKFPSPEYTARLDKRETRLLTVDAEGW